ncbi:MAG: ABC transporter permease [Bacteroidia bacterium]|nr:ABC transporter permease [Bacteroidia bacterium]
MNTEFFIARRLIYAKESQNNISKPIVTIAIVGIALGLIVMIVSVAIVTGFKSEIRGKIIGFGSHLQITNYDTNISYETQPISRNQPFLPELRKTEGVKKVQCFAIKAGIIKTKNEIEGVVLKGIGSDYDWSFFKKHIIQGNTFNINDSVKTDKVLISKSQASRLKLKLGDNLSMFFVQDSPEPRMRKFKIAGIYETSLEEFDKLYVLADIAHVQKLNNWTKDQVSGFEVLVNDFDRIGDMKYIVSDVIGYQIKEGSDVLKVVSVKEKFPQLFDWLELQDINVWVILGLMVIVAGFNMVSGLLILILERTNMIGVLKSLGSGNISIRKIFLYQAGMLISKGLLWGNIIGIALCLIQYYFGVIKLDAAAYYVSKVPISLNIIHIILLNTGTLLITVAMLVLPSYIVTKISPVKAIQFN